jgi:flagellar biosynthesis/type III secretory pathway protein FliH
MVRAMQQAGVRAVLIEDLIQIGQEEGFERGLEKGLERGLEKGLAQGQAQGQARTLTRQIERKLGRALGEGERQAVDRRLATLGADQVGDAVLDLDRDALAAWLAAAG